MAYLQNAWYVAALSSEVSDNLLARRLLDEPLVMFRGKNGEVAALQDRCPHRFVPLSLGRLADDAIQCGYHGLTFDGHGTCVRNPHGAGKIPSAAHVKSYPLVERHGFIWLWMGAEAAANPALIPADFEVFSNIEQYRVISGYLHVQANYQLITDNLLDLSHVEFMHPDFARGVPLNSNRSEMVQEGNRVSAYLWKDATPISRFQRLFWESPSEAGDGRSHMHWNAPCHLLLDTGMTEVGGGRQRRRLFADRAYSHPRNVDLKPLLLGNGAQREARRCRVAHAFAANS